MMMLLLLQFYQAVRIFQRRICGVGGWCCMTHSHTRGRYFTYLM